MEKTTDSKKDIQNRAVKTYLHPTYKGLVETTSREYELTESRIGAIAIKYLYDKVPADIRQQLFSKNSY